MVTVQSNVLLVLTQSKINVMTVRQIVQLAQTKHYVYHVPLPTIFNIMNFVCSSVLMVMNNETELVLKLLYLILWCHRIITQLIQTIIAVNL